MWLFSFHSRIASSGEIVFSMASLAEVIVTSSACAALKSVAIVVSTSLLQMVGFFASHKVHVGIDGVNFFININDRYAAA